jgi:beta-lactamase regulating signal transducer with metallopeptidase domain
MSDIFPVPNLADTQAFALAVAVSGACVCALVLLAARLFGRRSDPLSYGILLGGVAGLLAIPALVGVGQSLPAAFLWPAPPLEDEVVKVPAERLPELLNRPAPEALQVEEESPGSTVQIIGVALLAMWALGLAIGSGRLLHALWKQNRTIIGRPWCTGFWTEELKARLARKLGLKVFPDVYLSPVLPMPMVIGLWRPAIALPELAPASWGQPQWEAILLHEAAHIARRDPWAVLAQRVAVILFWWCPLVYALSRRLCALRERICDDYALQGPCDHIAYAELLVESAERLLGLKTLPAPLALLDSARGGLEARVTRLLEKERRPMIKLSLPGKLLGAGFLVAACLLTTATTALSGGQPQPQKNVQIKIIVDGKEIDLGDLQLGNVIEAAQKKAPATVSADVKVSGVDDKTIRVWGVDQPLVPGTVREGVRFVAQTVVAAQPKPDPRIEELVKQAEAIKPGSGAQIRSALQDTPKAGSNRVVRNLAVSPDIVYGIVADKSAPGSVRVWETSTGKKIIILSIEDGKVRQLQEKDLKKILEKGIRSDVKDAPKGATSGDRDTKKREPGNELNLSVRSRSPETKGEPTRTNEMESLRRQLERISAELQALKQRLDAPRK